MTREYLTGSVRRDRSVGLFEDRHLEFAWMIQIRLEQRAVVAERSVIPLPTPSADPAQRTKPAEQGRQLVAYRKSAYTTQND